jgi:glucan phosphoethanolaminetransferase (alkaline phosphatase superfamily)
LDLTFLRVTRRASQSASQYAFTIGFGLLFPLMIGITLLYAPLLAKNTTGAVVTAGWLLSVLVLAHVAWQSVFTIAAHNREASLFTRRIWHAVPACLIIVLLTMFGIRAAEHGWPRSGIAGLSIGEVIYRLFMSFYGLVFPAYVYLCMIPARGEGGTQKPTRQKLAVLAVACLLAAPCYWMGFIERKTVWLVPGLVIVLVSRLLIQPTTREAASPAAGGGGGSSGARTGGGVLARPEEPEAPPED